jgi:predicted TPR repeat methyltransferase
MQQQPNYKKDFAQIYDELMSGTKYDRWASMLNQLIAKNKINRGTALDVACGTGAISKMLLDMGFSRVFGLDKSTDMLIRAQEKLKSYGNRFQVINSDMAHFSQPQQYDLAVSFYDSINYVLDPKDVQKMIGNVRDCLRPGGYFIFDMNTKEHVWMSQKNPEREFKINGGVARFRFGGSGDIWSLDIDVNYEQGASFREVHLERGYSSEEIRGMLAAEGLTLVELIDENKIYWDKKEHLSRQYYVARKDL